MQSLEHVTDILYREAGAAIKYRIASEIYHEDSSKEIFCLRKELEDTGRVKKLIDCLKNHREYHGATLYAVENSLNILVDMGVRYGKDFLTFDGVLEELADEVYNRKIEGEHLLRYLPYIVVISALLRAGYRETWLLDFVKERIDVIYSFIVEGNYDIYDDANIYKRVPKNFRGRPIIKLDLYKDGQIKLPLEYDIHSFASVYSEISKDYRNKIDKIIAYIMNEKFRQIADGYGILSDKKNYWAMGWDPKPVEPEKEYPSNSLLLKMELLSNFGTTAKGEWLERALNVAETYKVESGLYNWPKKYLTEKDSCWILGNHMGVGENRRNNKALLYEGTFRTLTVINNLKKFES